MARKTKCGLSEQGIRKVMDLMWREEREREERKRLGLPERKFLFIRPSPPAPRTEAPADPPPAKPRRS